MTDADVPTLSEAVVLVLRLYPFSNEADYLRHGGTASQRAEVQALMDETIRIDIAWGHKTLSEIGDEVREIVAVRHPELTRDAVRKLGNYFTYTMK